MAVQSREDNRKEEALSSFLPVSNRPLVSRPNFANNYLDNKFLIRIVIPNDQKKTSGPLKF
jgi:hypothetical protein